MLPCNYASGNMHRLGFLMHFAKFLFECSSGENYNLEGCWVGYSKAGVGSEEIVALIQLSIDVLSRIER